MTYEAWQRMDRQAELEQVLNEEKHKEYLIGVEDGLTYNRGLGHWEDFSENCLKTSYYWRKGFKEITGIDPGSSW